MLDTFFISCNVCSSSLKLIAFIKITPLYLCIYRVYYKVSKNTIIFLFFLYIYKIKNYNILDKSIYIMKFKKKDSEEYDKGI